MTAPVAQQRDRVPVRTIAATIGMVLVTFVSGYLILKLERIITWLVIAGFFALILNPVVSFFHRRLRMRRGLAIFLTFLLGAGVLGGALYTFIKPIVDQTTHFANNFPRYVADAKAGRGTVGHIIKRYKLDQYIEKNQARFKQALSNAGKPAANIARKVASTLAAVITIIVLIFLMLAEGPRMKAGSLTLMPAQHRKRVEKVAADCTRAITGYVAGNLLISLIASVVTFVSLFILDVPFRAVLSLWVFFADLIPLVGATLGAIPTVLVAFIAAPVKGFIMIGIYVAYQQFENHVLQVTIMAKTVRLNPLSVLVSVLAGVELFGFLGALLAIPAAGVLQVIVRDLYDNRRGRLKSEPTIGADEVPVSEIIAEEQAEAAAEAAEEAVVGGGTEWVPDGVAATVVAPDGHGRAVPVDTEPPPIGGPFSVTESGEPLGPASPVVTQRAAAPTDLAPHEGNGAAPWRKVWAKVRGVGRRAK